MGCSDVIINASSCVIDNFTTLFNVLSTAFVVSIATSITLVLFFKGLKK